MCVTFSSVPFCEVFRTFASVPHFAGVLQFANVALFSKCAALFQV